MRNLLTYFRQIGLRGDLSKNWRPGIWFIAIFAVVAIILMPIFLNKINSSLGAFIYLGSAFMAITGSAIQQRRNDAHYRQTRQESIEFDRQEFLRHR